MAKVVVTYMVEMEQVIDWPDDELDSLNHENLVNNCEPENSQISDDDFQIMTVLVNGKYHELN